MAEMEMLNQLPTAASDRSYKFSDDTLRDTSTKYLTGALSALGMSDTNALRFARDFTGRPDMDDIGQSFGVLDFTPAGLVYGVDEAVDQFQAAKTPIDYIAPTVGLGLSAVEAFPVTKIMIKPLRVFLKNLGNKAVSDAPVDISRRKVVQGIADEIVDDGLSAKEFTKMLHENYRKKIDKDKRKTLKTLATVPAAAVATEPLIGALGNLPKGKVAKKVFKKLPKSKFDIPALINQVDEAVELGFRENIDMIDDDEAVELIKDLFDEKEMRKIGIDPKNITYEDLSNDEVVHYLKREPVNPNAYLDEQDLLESMEDEINDYLSGKLDLDDLDQGASGAYNLIKSLQDDYGLDREGIRKFLYKSSDSK